MSKSFDKAKIQKFMKKKKKEIREDDDLRLRISQLRAKMPKRFYYNTIYEYEFGPQTEEHLALVGLVWNLRATDKKITERLESICKKILRQ